MRRVLVTGSRDWADRNAVYAALEYHWAHSWDDGDGGIVVVHGDCPSGADKFAQDWVDECELLGFGETAKAEKHPAMWDRPCTTGCYHKPRFKNGKPYCPVAGMYRNQKMVDLGADVCVAFPLGDSRGTRDCMRRAERAGIPVEDQGLAA